MSVQDSVQCFQSIGLYLEKIREISLGAIVKRGELQPVCPEEAQPQLGALVVVMGRKGKAEAVFQPLLFFFSRQYMCNEDGLLVGGVATLSVLGLRALPQKVCSGCLYMAQVSAYCLPSRAVLCSLNSFPLGRFSGEG